MYFLSYRPFKFTLKSAKIRGEPYLRWNNSNLIMNWETILTLNNYMGEEKFRNYLRASGATPQLGHGGH